MRRSRFLRSQRLVPLVALALVASTFSLSQAGTAGASTLLVTARAKDGSPTEISAQDLAMKVDGKPASIQELNHLAAPALRYCILIDNSGSSRSSLHLERDEATELLTKIIQPGRDRGLLVNFNDQAYVDAESANPQDLVKALDKSTARGGTALYDALFACAEDISKSKETQDHDNILRLIFILSDGEDNSSHVTRDTALLIALNEKIRLYSFVQKKSDPNSSRTSARAQDTLREFARSTGAKAYFPANESDVPKIVADISDDLTNLFQLTYSSGTTPDGKIHKVEIKSARKGVVITAPDRYYSQAH